MTMRIAFVTGNAYSLLVDGESSNIGGSQIQQVYIGKELAKRGHDVIFIEDNSNEKKPQSVNGVKIRLRERQNISNRATQVYSWVLNTYDIIDRINPDVVYMRVLSFDLVPLYLTSRLTSCKLIYCFANDSETTSNPEIFKTPITNSRIYKYVLHRTLSSVDLLVAQNEFQYQNATRRFSTEVVQIPNGYPTTQVSKHSDRFASIDRAIILWVGNIRDVKDPLSFLDLAKALPEYYFVMVGGKRDREAELFEHVKTKSEKMENVRFEGFVPHSDITEYYAGASVFVNTSKSEGFPNTFLESWAHGVPVASLRVDPDDIIQENELGVVANGDIDSLRTEIQVLIGDESHTVSERCRTFLEQNFSIQRVADRYENEFSSLLDSG